MKSRKRKYFLTVLTLLIIGISASSCTTRYITPSVEYDSITILANNQPNCKQLLAEYFFSETLEDALNAFKCYDDTIQYWQNEYESLEVQLDAFFEENHD